MLYTLCRVIINQGQDSRYHPRVAEMRDLHFLLNFTKLNCNNIGTKLVHTLISLFRLFYSAL